ncbi:MAG: hypothetical protein ABL895_17510 [Cyclobacteriaceae bacterium]
MSDTKICESPHLEIRLSKDNDFIELLWNGFIPSTEFRELAAKIFDALDKTGVNRILSDNTNWKIISPQDLGWAANRWFPKAESRGVIKLGSVLSQDIFNRSAERTIDSLTEIESMKVRHFEGRQEAINWLRESD